MSHSCNRFTPVTNRRDFLRHTAAGFGWLALVDMLHRSAVAETRSSDRPLAPRPPQYPARANRVIFLFMHGGPSHMDTFDYKPQLARDDGKPLPFPKPRIVSGETQNLLGSPWKFRQHGQCGAWVSEVFPEVAKHVDELCMLHGMHGSNSRHGAALLELHTGSDTFVRPSMGSWIAYGLGTENENLPAYMTICPTLTHGGSNNHSSAFLPAIYAGTPVGAVGIPSERAKIPFISPQADTSPGLQRRELDLLDQLNRQHLVSTGPDAALESRMASFELAFRMQREAPQIQDISREPEAMLRLYGLDNPVTADFGRQCLMARRFAERGVRFVQVSHSYKWDQHGDLRQQIPKNASQVDQPIAGLLTDLRQRGLLDDTLVLWGGEFGRTPTSQGKRNGRDHNAHGFTMWLAGGGVRPGMRWGATDDYGYYAVENKVHFHDLHATMLHLLGLNHTELIYRHGGRDFRLTDVYGEVVQPILG